MDALWLHSALCTVVITVQKLSSPQGQFVHPNRIERLSPQSNPKILSVPITYLYIIAFFCEWGGFVARVNFQTLSMLVPPGLLSVFANEQQAFASCSQIQVLCSFPDPLQQPSDEVFDLDLIGKRVVSVVKPAQLVDAFRPHLAKKKYEMSEFVFCSHFALRRTKRGVYTNSAAFSFI